MSNRKQAVQGVAAGAGGGASGASELRNRTLLPEPGAAKTRAPGAIPADKFRYKFFAPPAGMAVCACAPGRLRPAAGRVKDVGVA